MDWQPAPDIAEELEALIDSLQFNHINPKRIITYRSTGSKARIRARIWSLPRVWQMALKVQAHYIIEVKSEVYDQLPKTEQTKTLIHELMHIPKTFSGALAPHHGRFHKINSRTVEQLFRQYLNSNK